MKKIIISLLMMLVVVGVASAANCTDGNASTECPCNEDLSQFDDNSSICYINGSLTLAGGTYDINGTINMYGDSVLDGNESTINRGENSYFIEVLGDNVTVSDFTLDDRLLVANSYDEITIDSVNASGSGVIVDFDGVVNGTIKNNRLISSSTPTVQIFEPGNVNNIIIHDNYIQSFQNTLQINQGSDYTIYNNELVATDISSNEQGATVYAIGITGMQFYDNNITAQNSGFCFSTPCYNMYIDNLKNANFSNNRFVNQNPNSEDGGIGIGKQDFSDVTSNVTFYDNYIEGQVKARSFNPFNGFIEVDFINNNFSSSNQDHDWRRANDVYYEGNTMNDVNTISVGLNTGTFNYVYEPSQKGESLTFDVGVVDVYFNATSVDTEVFYTNSVLGANTTTVSKLDDELKIGDTWVYVNSSSYLNKPATLTFRNLPNDGSEYRVLKDGVYKVDGDEFNLTYNDLSTLAINVSEFSNWSLALNNPPVIENFSPTNTTLTNITGESIIFAIDNVSDVEGDPINYQWYVNGVAQSGENGSSFTYNTDYEDEGYNNVTAKVNDTFDEVQQEWNITLNYYPTTLLPVINTFTGTTIQVDWTTNADNVSIYLNDVFETTSTSNSYLFESLSPSTSYTIKIVPHKDGYDGEPKSVSQATAVSDNNPPIMVETLISPTSGFTDTVFTGSCRATDIDDADIYYEYAWYVNGSVVKSGTSGLASQATTESIGSLLTTNYVKGDNLTLECRANDGLATSSALNTSLIIQNSPAEIADIFLIEVNATDYLCNHTYVDVDDDPEITPSYMWYANGVATGNTTVTVPISDFSVGDEIFCAVETGDGIGPNATANSSTFVVGDSNPPDNLEVTEYDVDVYNDVAIYVEAECTSAEDDIAGGYPVLRMIDPNLNELQYSFFYTGTEDRYYRYITYSTAGTYTDVNVECCDGNDNCIDIDQPDVLSSVRETVVNIGGGGGSGGTTEPFREITSFNIIPQSINFVVQPGGSVIGEVEIENTDIVPINFNIQVLRNEQTPESYRWIEFADNKRSASFAISPSGGLEPSNRFVTYTIDVPADAEFGTYFGSIEVSGLDQTGLMEITIDVQEQAPGLLGFFQQELFSIPSTRKLITDDVIAEEVGSVRPVSVGLTLIIVGGLVGILLITRGVIIRARKR